ncbi:MAG: hypothetical protein AB1792_08675 [Candidatus Zixiibacteriota bacterium]
MKSIRAVCGLCVVVVIASLSTAVAAEFPRLMNFQGRLDDTAGVPVPDANYTVTFRLFDIPTGGTALWTETQSIATTAGVFSVLLGDVDTIPPYVYYRDSLYLEVQPNGSDPVLPRSRLTVVPYARRAHDADLLTGATVLDLEESNEIDAQIATHTANSSAHHSKTVDASELVIGTLPEGRLPQGAIDSTEIEMESVGANRLADEPGIAYTFTDLKTLSSTMAVMDSAIITVPRGGYIFIIANGWFYRLHTQGAGDCIATVSLSGSRVSHEDNHTAKFTVLSAEVSGHHTQNFTVSRVLPVGPGQTKVYFLGDLSGTGTCQVQKAHITTLYFPTPYGNIDITAQ